MASEEENWTAGEGANEKPLAAEPLGVAQRKEPLPWPGAFTSQGTRGPGNPSVPAHGAAEGR